GPLGRATTFASRDSGHPSTGLPAGTRVGDVLMSYIESYASSSVRCSAPWVRVFDLADGKGARLVACVIADTGKRPVPAAEVSPPSQVSMVTMAFAGVDS